MSRMWDFRTSTSTEVTPRGIGRGYSPTLALDVHNGQRRRPFLRGRGAGRLAAGRLAGRGPPPPPPPPLPAVPGRIGGSSPAATPTETPPDAAAAAAGVSGAPTAPPRLARRARMLAYRGSRSLNTASSGEAM